MLQVASVHIYPVKSLHGISPERITFDPWGPRGDRRWLVITPDGDFITQRNAPVMATIAITPTKTGLVLHHTSASDHAVPFPSQSVRTVQVWGDSLSGADAGNETADWLSAVIGRPCRLVHMVSPETERRRNWNGQDYHVSFADEFPGLLCTSASLTDLNTRLANPVPMTRFRPNLVIEGTAPWEEDTWSRLKIGAAELHLVKPCSRCVVTTTDQDAGTIPEPGQPLKELAEFRRQPGGIMFGQNILVKTPGPIRIGDSVEILERVPS
ncbi:MOSC domain-containing protein [Acetobacter fallax]|uniref:MOSC domain-containing protein n=1 Tax=Acetobacter fallax TaxID=1737473 RepID=A0ABX0KDK9_9PROT|nr:MOSC N-terminal beta barrel domain-containing protein [Acetobacter fallax]NHO33554.1 MOSC domain-containing protein [Acetobacter fallax]NHO36523.1 MOSC domain-containing protein [Acetobacter fallax]